MNYTFREILLILLSVALLLPLYLYLEKDPVISSFFAQHKTTVFVFLILFAALVMVSVKLYHNSLDYNDEETVSTLKASKINISVWCLFWIVWSVTNVVILFSSSIEVKLIILSVLLTNIPGILLFIFTFTFRRDQLRSYPELLREDGITTIFNGEYQSLSFRYFSGFYGLITWPVYGLGCLGYYLF